MLSMKKRVMYNKYDSGNAFFLSIISPQLLGFALVLAVMLISSILGISYQDAQKNVYVNAFVTLSAQLSFVIVFFLYNKKTNTNWIKATGLNNKVNWINIVVCLVVSIVSIFGLNGIVSVFEELIALTGYNSNSSLPIPLDNGWWFVVNLIGLAILPALFEELIFRGIILSGLKQYGKVAAIFGSAALFALLHGNISQFIYPFVLGIILGFVVYKTGNVLYSIIIHLCNNTIVVVLNFINEINNIFVDTNYLTWKYILISIGTALVAGVIIFVLIRFALKAKNKNNITLDDIEIQQEQKQDNTKDLPNKFMTAGIVFGVVLWLLDFILGFMPVA